MAVVILALLVSQVKLVALRYIYIYIKILNRQIDGNKHTHTSVAGRVNWQIFLESKGLKKYTFQFNPLFLLTRMYPKAIIWNSDTYLPKDINSNITIKK